MAISKRTRFEVLRRDDYTCRYCRSKENALTIDHVVPQALGGSDDPSNLVACCKDCNAGKSSATPDQALVDDIDADAARWIMARARAVGKLQMREVAAAEARQPFLDDWMSWDKSCSSLPGDWHQSIDYWLRDGITMPQILKAHDIAVSARTISSSAVFRYMAGIIRNWLRELDDATRAELDSDGA